MTKINYTILVGLLVTTFAIASPSSAQQSAKEYEGEIATARAKVAKKSKIVVTKNLQLTEAEANEFWPLYDRYRADMTKLGDREVKLITDYADAHVSKSLTDAKAIKLLKKAMDIDERRLKIRKQYLGRFKEVLPPKKVVRFYQTENKLNAELDYWLARQIPLVE